VTADTAAKNNPEIVFVIAVAENGVIGRDNALPWHLKSDLQRFKKMTLGKPIIMGRKTFASIGKPLPGRTNIVVTRDSNFKAEGVAVAASLDAAHKIATEDALRRNATEIMVIGGAAIFASALPRAGRIHLTEVHATPPGDVRMPAFSSQVWREVAREPHGSSHSYVTLERIPGRN